MCYTLLAASTKLGINMDDIIAIANEKITIIVKKNGIE